MFKPIALLFACLAATGLAASPRVYAAENTAAACAVAIDYLYNGVVADSYRRDFVVTQDAAFVDDLSTPLRAKTFTATVSKELGVLAVSIDYFSDVGVFVAIGFDTSLTLRGDGGTASTSGSHGTFISTGVTPPVVGGNHTTQYVLACGRA